MDEKRPIELPLPPRRLPGAVRGQLKRSVLMPRLFGLIWLATGLVMLVVFLFISHPLADVQIRRDHTLATGAVTGVTRDGNRNPYRVAYTFADADGVQHSGRSFTGTRPALEPGEQVKVEYMPVRPRWSRIAGMRYAVFPATMHILPLVFLVSGAAVWFTGVVKLARLRHVYEHGVVTVGAVLREKWYKLMRVNTGFRTPSRYLYELRYRFRDDRGLERDAVHRTYVEAGSLHFAEGDTIIVLFDRANPARSMAVEVLGVEPTADRHR
ncbi:MAG: DUF3592 domain-containing protein [Verrucomicrobia bacterium]|nr:DUF3592 domain-containing protein [Verrucomicrobiota bacterium]